MNDKKTVREHLKDIKKLFFNIIIVYVISFFALFFVGDYLVQSLLNYYNMPIVSLQPFDIIMAKMQFAMLLALLFIMPYTLYKIIEYLNIKINKLFVYIISILTVSGFSIGLFVSAKYLLLGLSLDYLNILWSVNSIINIVLIISITLALAFQLLYIIPILIQNNIISHKGYQNKRKYFILVMFIILALVTASTDIFSLIIMTVPLILCIELGFLVSLIINGGKIKCWADKNC